MSPVCPRLCSESFKANAEGGATEEDPVLLLREDPRQLSLWDRVQETRGPPREGPRDLQLVGAQQHCSSLHEDTAHSRMGEGGGRSHQKCKHSLFSLAYLLLKDS